MRSAVLLFLLACIICPGTALALVNINTASLEELETLTGIGPAYAERIVSARPFSSIEDVMQVKGIGTATYEKIKSEITVTAATVVAAAPATAAVSGSSGQSTEAIHATEPPPVARVVITAPATAYVNQPVEFSAGPSDGMARRTMRYAWNFGDGETDTGSDVGHIYRGIGTYVAVVEAYHNKETMLARQEVTVLPVKVSLTPAAGGLLTITNTGPAEIDLFGMSLRGKTQFFFPRHSLVLPGASITVRSPAGQVALFDNAGMMLTGTGERAAAGAQPPRPRAPVSSAEDISTPTPTVAGASTTAAVTAGPESIAAAPAAAADPFSYWPYAGLAALILLGGASLWYPTRGTEA